MLEAPPLPSLLYIYIYIYIYMSVVCDKGKGRPLGELKATFSTALKVLQCSKTIMSYDQSQCVLLALCVCALGQGLTEKVLGLGQRSPPPPFGGGWGPPPPPYSPPNCRTPLGVTHWLAAAPVENSRINRALGIVYRTIPAPCHASHPDPPPPICHACWCRRYLKAASWHGPHSNRTWSECSKSARGTPSSRTLCERNAWRRRTGGGQSSTPSGSA